MEPQYHCRPSDGAVRKSVLYLWKCTFCTRIYLAGLKWKHKMAIFRSRERFRPSNHAQWNRRAILTFFADVCKISTLSTKITFYWRAPSAICEMKLFWERHICKMRHLRNDDICFATENDGEKWKYCWVRKKNIAKIPIKPYVIIFCNKHQHWGDFLIRRNFRGIVIWHKCVTLKPPLLTKIGIFLPSSRSQMVHSA